jgi:adenylylsulfate kinase
MGWLCDQVTKTGCFAIADFICPTPDARAAFTAGGEAFIVWMDSVVKSRFDDTDRVFVAPERHDLRVPAEGTAEYWAEQVAKRIRPIFDPKRPTALFVGRYQPFHEGYKACVAVRDTGGADEKNPFEFEYVRARIEHALREFEGRFVIIPIPNITGIFFGHDVGYGLERIDLGDSYRLVSATNVRKRLFDRTSRV